MNSYQTIRGGGILTLTLDDGRTMQFAISRAEVGVDTEHEEINEITAAGHVALHYGWSTTRISMEATVDKTVVFEKP